MSIHLHIQKQPDVSYQASISSSDSDDDQTFDDWNDSLFSGSEFRIQSLFDDTTVGSIGELLSYDQEKYGVDLDAIWAKLRGRGVVDSMGRVRLVNWIKKTKPTPEMVVGLTGSEDFSSRMSFWFPSLRMTMRCYNTRHRLTPGLTTLMPIWMTQTHLRGQRFTCRLQSQRNCPSQQPQPRYLGKIEDIEFPFYEDEETGVDIISEWMGYALLYKSMFGSVLVAKRGS
ncbi:hypothetical protein VKT23_007746 [Stygiomarasmius scandens]|uniref:Uncharacterized protein n=1 Tax=Marasmiellus scandens TaxID=2682957 RepID=A0ABR1JMJ0_9AGAR